MLLPPSPPARGPEAQQQPSGNGLIYIYIFFVFARASCSLCHRLTGAGLHPPSCLSLSLSSRLSSARLQVTRSPGQRVRQTSPLSVNLSRGRPLCTDTHKGFKQDRDGYCTKAGSSASGTLPPHPATPHPTQHPNTPCLHTHLFTPQLQRCDVVQLRKLLCQISTPPQKPLKKQNGLLNMIPIRTLELYLINTANGEIVELCASLCEWPHVYIYIHVQQKVAVCILPF